jgi:DNA-binding transcriptional regulator LsrR (DeoR family)
MINELKFYIDNGWSGIGISSLHAYLIIKESGGMSRNELAKALDMSLDQAGTMISRLKRLGLLRVETENRPFMFYAISLEN